MPRNQNWTREESILAINLYMKLPFGKMHNSNPEVIKLSKLIPRSPSAIARKLGNFASFDPSLQERGVGGLPHTSKLDQEIWDEFYNDWESLSYESEALRAKYEGKEIKEMADPIFEKEGLDKTSQVKTRVNQNFFRAAILASYNYTCCITGISLPTLLVAGHIKKWSEDKKNRMNPHNGLCLNVFHDKAFEQGLITITLDYTVQVSPVIMNEKNTKNKQWLEPYHNKSITLPNKFLPDANFLKVHNESRFLQE